jgi:hypothetical protein
VSIKEPQLGARVAHAAVEPLKLGREAICYLARILDCDEKTIR